MMGGISTEEMEQWLNHHEDKLPKFENDEERAEIEDLTGRIPLLPQHLLQFGQNKYCAVEKSFWACQEIAAVRRNMHQCNDYIETLCSCITRTSTFGHPGESFDSRYFYPDGPYCAYTCGLAREAATTIIAEEARQILRS